jgi:hypothetical protein
VQQRIVGGGHTIVEVNGAVVGRFSECSYTVDPGTDEIVGVDSDEPHEIASTTTRVRGTLRMWRTKQDGGAEGAGLAAPPSEMQRGLYFHLRLLDRLGGYVLFESDRCKAGQQQWTISAKRLVSGTVDFTGIGWRNEVQILR